MRYIFGGTNFYRNSIIAGWLTIRTILFTGVTFLAGRSTQQKSKRGIEKYFFHKS